MRERYRRTDPSCGYAMQALPHMYKRVECRRCNPVEWRLSNVRRPAAPPLPPPCCPLIARLLRRGARAERRHPLRASFVAVARHSFSLQSALSPPRALGRTSRRRTSPTCAARRSAWSSWRRSTPGGRGAPWTATSRPALRPRRRRPPARALTTWARTAARTASSRAAACRTGRAPAGAGRAPGDPSPRGSHAVNAVCAPWQPYASTMLHSEGLPTL